MSTHSRRIGSWSILASALGLFAVVTAGCSGNYSTTPLAASPTPTPTPVVAAACAGQTSGTTSSSVTETLLSGGGSFCIPSYGGFGGTIAYPAVSSPVNVTVTSSTTNVAGYPALGSSSPIFYLGLALSGPTTFGTGGPAGGGLTATSAAIVPGTTYSVYGQATLFGVAQNFTTCQTVATASGTGGTISGLGTVLNNVSVPVAVNGVLEIEPGASGSGAC
jgi:hypothetical protein